MLNVLCDHRPLTRLNSTPLLSLAGSGWLSPPPRPLLPSPFFRSCSIFSRGVRRPIQFQINCRIRGGGQGGQRSGGNQGWKRWGTRAVSRTTALVLADNISWPRRASRCFIAPRRELESGSFHEGRISLDTWTLNCLIQCYVYIYVA